MPAISIKNINKTYIDQDGNEVQALHDINLDVAEGEFVCIVGPSGCGKSTLLEIVAGLLDATSGEVLLDGQPVHGTSRDIGVVFQDASLFPWRTVRKNVAFGLEIAQNPCSLYGKGLLLFYKTTINCHILSPIFCRCQYDNERF